MFTVFTATYKRAHVLHRPYESLQKQTFRDFEWVIIDDHSDDGTRELVNQWQQEAEFPIRFETQDEDLPGKHHAFNQGVEMAQGTFFYPVDSDDELLPDALEKLYNTWQAIPEEDRDDYSGVAGLCVDTDGSVVGDQYPESPFDSDIIETRYRYRITGEKSGMNRTDVLQDHPFPEIEGQRHIPESLVWDAIAVRYSTRYINKELLVYHNDEGTSQLTTDGDSMKSSKGHVLCRRNRLNDQLQWAPYAPFEFIKSAIQFSRYATLSGMGIKDQMMGLRWAARPLWLICLPIGVTLAIKDQH